MKKVKKDFRLNVLICYHKNINILNVRNPIHSIFKNLAWVHRLDYAIEELVDTSFEAESDLYGTTDVVYLKSTDLTVIDRKVLQQLVRDLFLYAYTMSMGLEVYYQMQKVLVVYPFPKEFVRPLNYPYLEYHKDGQSEIKIPVADFEALFPDLNIENDS